jgi:hypothetical protein
MKTSGCASLHEEEEGEVVVVVVVVLSRFGSTTSESKKDFRSELFLSTESFRDRRLRQEATRIRCAAFEEEEAIKKKALSLSLPPISLSKEFRKTLFCSDRYLHNADDPREQQHSWMLDFFPGNSAAAAASSSKS